MHHRRTFFKYVIPSIIAFALSGVYAIIDGFFVGNTIGDMGLSAINMAYPVVARVFNTSQNYRFSYQPIKWAFSFTFLVKFLDFLYRIFSYVMV